MLTNSKEIDVRNFIQENYTPYYGDESFLTSATSKTEKLWSIVKSLMAEETKKGILDVETKIPASVNAYEEGYIDKDLEEIVGLQTDAPLKRGLLMNGGWRVVKKALQEYGYELDPKTEEIYSKYRKTHNDGVFDAYTSEMLLARKTGVITGLPDAYSRGRIIGDYRRVALYGVDALVEDKIVQKDSLAKIDMSEENIKLREEISEQIKALSALKAMAARYGFDISKPATNAKEAIQWLYFGYLAATKEQDGAAMSLGRVATFLDIYIEQDLLSGILTEETAQELVDHFIMKLRMVRFLRPGAYNELFSGDPVWVTESLAGMGEDGRTLVTKTTYRVLHTLYTLGPAPEPNLTVLWSKDLPENFKKYCAKVSIDTSSIQYENDDLMRKDYGDDYGIACCVSAMRIGKQMQFFGARANLAKALLYAINGGVDEVKNIPVVANLEAITSDILNYDEVMEKFDKVMDWLANIYVNTLNVIHYMHDKYHYEALEMALHDKEVFRTMACGIAGLSVVADSLSAIKYAEVKAVRDENGLAISYEINGEYPAYGNLDDRVDSIADMIVEKFMNKIRNNKPYRNATPTQSVLTITSNVVYGKKTGDTPCGRKFGEPFAPGANPFNGRDNKGALASLSSVAKLNYENAKDGISNTFSIVPKALGREDVDRVNNLVAILDGYFIENGHHLNINVFKREFLLDAMEHPEKYPQLTIRVSGYAVNFIKLTREQQLDVINRTIHEKV